MDNTSSTNQSEPSTRDRILASAARLFAKKGYAETSVRELAVAVGLNSASLYYHFPSKNAILEQILQDYLDQVWYRYIDPMLNRHLRDNPTSEGITSYMMLRFPEDRSEYFVNVLSILLQEQHRNPDIRRYVAENLLDNESYIKTVFCNLKEQRIIRPDADPDLWMKIFSSVLYAYSNRMLLGIGDSSPNYTGLSMEGVILEVLDLMLKVCGTVPAQQETPKNVLERE